MFSIVVLPTRRAYRIYTVDSIFPCTRDATITFVCMNNVYIAHVRSTLYITHIHVFERFETESTTDKL